MACRISGTACALVAVPIMGNQNLSTSQVWWLVAFVLPLVSTTWIVNAPLMVTSIFPAECQSQGTSLIMAFGTALAGFFPLLLHQSEVSDKEGIGGDYRSGILLAFIAGTTVGAIYWIGRKAIQGRIVIYQRPDLL